ncbi:putative C2 NT-type domain-containing protein [Seiridium cardinale]|uniref:C2 NT-type domain-containing protein n=1 Tax=Seiridium cardinale TaxID=138064 RepID=A0ABR2XHV6_9PEZI
MPSLLPIVNKARKPKFDLHLTIYDLNNVPLVSGTSQIKWHLPHSIHGEHRGRTDKCPIDSVNHRVSFDYNKVVPLRITIDKNNSLTECPIEFEVVQEFPASGGRDEKITLGVVKLNLSEYVEESENFPRKSLGSRMGNSLEHARKDILGPALHGKRRMSTASGPPSASVIAEEQEHEQADEGIVRRYLMQESKINSTLKLGILMVQVDGDRSFVAPPLKTAPMFGGIAGIMAGETVEPVDEAPLGTAPTVVSQNKSRDASELQDMYRRALAASWCCQPNELPADECIEDIFAGGNGWKESHPGGGRKQKDHSHSRGRHPDDASTTSSGSEEVHGGTLRPSDVHKIRDQLSRANHSRSRSGASEKSLATLKGGRGNSRKPVPRPHLRDDPFDDGLRSRSESIASLAPTLGSLGSGSGSGSGRDGYGIGGRSHREVNEFDMRDDLVSWALPGTTVS